MAKLAGADEKPFRPLDVATLNAVVNHTPASQSVAQSSANPSGRPREVVAGLPVPPARTGRNVGQSRQLPANPGAPRLDQEKRILYTREEAQAIDRLVNNLAVRVQAQVKVSHVIRALTSLLLHAEAQVDPRAGEHGPLIRPPNGDFGALQRFERAIAGILANALRDAGGLP